MTREEGAALIREKDEVIAHLTDRIVEVEAAKVAKAALPAPIDPAALRVSADRAVAEVVERMAAAASRVDATAARVAKSAGADPAGDGGGTLAEALGIARAEAQEAADAARGPRTSGYWKAALIALGERLAPDLPPNAQMNAALQSSEGKLLLASMERNVGQGAKR